MKNQELSAATARGLVAGIRTSIAAFPSEFRFWNSKTEDFDVSLIRRTSSLHARAIHVAPVWYGEYEGVKIRRTRTNGRTSVNETNILLFDGDNLVHGENVISVKDQRPYPLTMGTHDPVVIRRSLEVINDVLADEVLAARSGIVLPFPPLSFED